MEKENKPFSKKKLIAIITVTIIGIIAIIVGVTLIVVNSNNKEIETSVQPENIQEENTIEEKENNTKFHIVSTENNDNVEESEDNVNGMRFKMTLSDFVEKYNTIIRETEDVPEFFTIEDSDFSLLANSQGIKTYGFIRYVIGSNRTRYAIALYVEENSNKIVEISFSMANEDFDKFNSQQQSRLLTVDMPQVIRTIDNKLTMDGAYELIERATTFKPNIYFKDNMAITTSSTSEVMIFKVSAISKEKYKETFNQIDNTDTAETSTDTDTSTSENYYEHPQEWYDEQERLYSEDTSSTSSSQSNSNQSSSASTSSRPTTSNNSGTSQQSSSSSQSNSNQSSSASTSSKPTTSNDNKGSTENSNNYETPQQQETTEIESSTALVRVIVNNTDTEKKYQYVGKPVKVMIDNNVQETNYFNGDNYSPTFLDIPKSNVTIKVYIDGTLIKTQNANIGELYKKGTYYTDVTVNI